MVLPPKILAVNDLNVVEEKQLLNASVATNDNNTNDITYSLLSAAANNPSMDRPTILPDGSFSFTSTTFGDYSLPYKFVVPICPIYAKPVF